MCTISNTVDRKIVNSIKLDDLEIETDSGWQPITSIHKTIPYTVWEIKTSLGLVLECADTHILFDEQFNEIFTKDLIENKTKIITVNGPDLVISVVQKSHKENMFDLTVDHPNHRFYSNGILSHNTSIINALSYALYGQALTNIKKDNLINHTNGKNMLVTVEFEKGSNVYRVERGRKPNVLKFYINNTELKSTDEDESQGDSRETQKTIEQCLEMSHTMFKHLVALNTYTEPFLSMRAADQREVIEQLLGITLLSEKAESLKLMIKDTKDQIQAESSTIEAIKTANENVQKSINSLRLKSTAWASKKANDIASFQEAIEHLEKVDISNELLLHEQLKKWEENDSQLRNLKKQQASLETALYQTEKSLSKLSGQLIKIKDNKCPTCEQDLQDHNHHEMIKSVEQQHHETITYQSSLIKQLEQLVVELKTVENQQKKPITFYETEAEALGHKNNLDQLNKQLLLKINESNPYEEQIEELEKTAIQEISWQKINELSELKDHQEFLHKLLTNKDSFIRKKIIDQNLSYLNKRLSYYIDKMGLPHRVVFQNDLGVEITQLGQDLDFDNLSRGERNRVILSTSFAFRDVWEGLYDSINVLFIDELLDFGMDGAGIEAGMSVLKKMVRDRNKNVYLISHKDELIGRVGNVLRVTKVNGFTEYNSENSLAP